MTILQKVGLLLVVGIAVFIWNKYVIQMTIAKVVKMNPKNNWLTENRNTIIKGFQGFYWLFYLLLLIVLLL